MGKYQSMESPAVFVVTFDVCTKCREIRLYLKVDFMSPSAICYISSLFIYFVIRPIKIEMDTQVPFWKYFGMSSTNHHRHHRFFFLIPIIVSFRFSFMIAVRVCWSNNQIHKNLPQFGYKINERKKITNRFFLVQLFDWCFFKRFVEINLAAKF